MDDPADYMARLCKSRVKNGGDDNYHTFINSVEGISKIIRRANLIPTECRIVCSKSADWLKENLSKLPDGFEIQTTLDPVKTFNFYTSTCFEGQDIFDQLGRTFIVSEKHKDHTKVDVMTTLPQICGRIRDSRYKNEVTQIYSVSPFKEVALEEYKESIRIQVEQAEHDAELLNKLSKDGKAFLKGYVNKAPYIGIVDGKIVVDRNLANLQIVRKVIEHDALQRRMVFQNENGIYNIRGKAAMEAEDLELDELKSIERTSFKDIFEEYVDLCKDTFNLNCFRKSRIEVEKPLVREAYEKLGASKVREMNYHQSNIKRELVKLEHETLETKIFLLLDGQLPKQVAIPRAEIKEKLESIYKELGIKKAAKATDLNTWYYTKPTSKRLSDGTIQSCLAIVSAKYQKK